MKKTDWFEVCYTQNDGRKITGQLYTADRVSECLTRLIEWGATDIFVREYKEA